MSNLEWNTTKKYSSPSTETVELEISKSTLKTAERKAGAYRYKNREKVLQEAIGIGIKKVI